KTEFAPARRVDGAGELAAKFTLKSAAAVELVFVNGHFDPQLSNVQELPKGVRALTIEQAFESDPALLHRHLGRHANIEKHSFAALNTGFVGEGAVVHLTRG